MKKLFQDNAKVISIKLQYLWRDFDNLSMTEGGTIQAFFSRVSIIINQIRSYGDTILDKMIVEKILRCLPAKFDNIVAVIEESKDLSTLSLHELMGSLEAHEQRISRFNNQPLEQAFQSKINLGDKHPQQRREENSQKKKKSYASNGKPISREGQHQRYPGTNKYSYCIICKRNNHDSKNCKFRCTKCKIANHSQKDCWYQKEDSSYIAKDEASGRLFYSCMNIKEESQDIWYVDSGCSNHMTGNKDAFVSLENGHISQVKLGDGKFQKIEGKGVISVKTKQGNSKFIHDVYYVPGLTENLLSVGQLMENGYSLKFDDGKCIIFDKRRNQIITEVKMAQNKVFPLSMTIQDGYILKVTEANESYLWHLRFGHLNFRSLILLKKKNMVVGLPNIKEEDKICEGCIYGKMHRLSFTNSFT